jgi:transposase
VGSQPRHHRSYRSQKHRNQPEIGKHRWVIERSIAWLFGYRRLTIRYERKANHFSAFLTLAATLVYYKKHIK